MMPEISSFLSALPHAANHMASGVSDMLDGLSGGDHDFAGIGGGGEGVAAGGGGGGGTNMLAAVGSTLLSLAGNKEHRVEVESKAMSLAAHATLDFAEMWTQATVAIRVAEVVGRLMVVGQNFLPGHTFMPDEMVFQLGFLVVSMQSLHKVVQPKIKAAQQAATGNYRMTPGDRKAYQTLFKPAGLDWNQYREISLDSMEWVHLESGQTMQTGTTNAEEKKDAGNEDESVMYWLHKGEVCVDKQAGDEECSLEQLVGGNNSGTNLIGEDQLAEVLGLSSSNLDLHAAGPNGARPAHHITAGQAGAKLLKINTQKLEQVIRHDNGLASSVHKLLFRCMQDKLNDAKQQQRRGPFGEAPLVAATAVN